MPPLLVYSVLRLLAFLVPLGIMWLFPIMRELWWLTVIFAALIGMSLSILFLRAPLASASTEIYERRQARTGSGRQSAAEQDAEAEDAAIDETGDTRAS